MTIVELLLLVGCSLAAFSCFYLVLDLRLQVGSICHMLVFKIQHMCMHTHKCSMNLCDNYAVLIVTIGTQQFTMASLCGVFGYNNLAA